MTTILIVEDDDAIRNNITRLLKLEGYEIVAATNGREGLECARAHRPDVVISDIGMPEMDGFELLQALRGERSLASMSFMMLTALDDRASMRRGMTAGADDYLAKPFTRVELLEALQGLLKKRGRIEETIESAVRSREEHLRLAFTESLGGRRLADKFGLEPPAGAVTDQVMRATVLFSDIRGFTSLAEKLSANEVAELLTDYFERVTVPVLTNGGRHLKFIGDGLMAVFAEGQGGSPLTAARRAISAALALALAAHEFRGWLDQRFPKRGLPPFAIGVGLHAGEVAICRVGTVDNRDTMPIGEAVSSAARLESSSKELGWTVVASNAVLQEAGDGVQTGGMTSLEVEGRSGYLDVAEIVGLVTNIDDKRHGMATLTERAAEIRTAVQVNSEITARAVKGALNSKLSAFKHHAFGADGEPLRLKGYRLVRKIGAGGMTEVYLAVREEDGLAVVLKVLSAGGRATSANLSRFIQEYTLLSKIEHPNVIRIYDQGFTDDHAYIAMEYFPRGDLRGELKAGMSQHRVLEVVHQVATALDAIHTRGVIHRDLKPENIMLRPEGSVALADFGVAKSMLQQDGLGLTETRHGDVVGTPYYLSPEQASGARITPSTDLYSLGVMLYEMLTGERPFVAESLDMLLARHVSAPTPLLPPPHEPLQPVLEKLMAKKPEDRYRSAYGLIQDLHERTLLRTRPGATA
ncbi:MAG TPA: protein kinase [Ramlibacter sp.]|uniref:protein kinase domain-containing protein n=1 Tax=Ramlibacter sp. TaxID=1917967 RepID=UPI002BE47A4B|nr:protein kinase [Ramlibacter sp.]HVZ46378.1 protein kinase [Ramlibacter sp.]